MTDGDALHSDSNIDLAAVQLDYEGFRQLSLNPNLTQNEKIGFPEAYRSSFGPAILTDILAKLPILSSASGKLVLDIGPGCAELPHLLLKLCQDRAHVTYLMDSPEMLDQIISNDKVHKRPGMFPRDYAAVEDLTGRVDALLCYSVFHYIYVEANPFTFVDMCVKLLAPGGHALIGDIPNLSKRRRFFSSDAGHAFHREFTQSTAEPMVEIFPSSLLKIDDAVLNGMVARAQAAGCHAYVVPQGPDLPMANRRDDLVFMKP